MNLTVNGQSQVPPGFRFHPTEEELLLYYLKKKVANQKIDLDVIQDVDLNKLEPWDIQEKCRIGSSAQNDWYFFSHKDKKYPTGTRTNRATAAGFWKATGRDKVIRSSSRRIGMRKTLVFYMGRAPHGEKSDWIMHEYRLDDITPVHDVSSSGGDQSSAMEEGWVVCRVFKKKNYVKALDSPPCRSSLQPIDRKTVLSSMTHDLDHILSYMGKTTTTTNTNTNINNNNNNNNNNKTAGIRYIASSTSLTNMDQVVQERFQHLPQLESPTDHVPEPQPFDPDGSSSINSTYPPNNDHHQLMFDCASYKPNWVELDRLVAYQLNGESAVEASESARRLSYINSTFHPTNQSTTMPFCLTDDNDGSDEHTASPTASFQQLLLSQSSPAYDSETAEDQLYWSFARPSSASSPSLDLIHHSSA